MSNMFYMHAAAYNFTRYYTRRKNDILVKYYVKVRHTLAIGCRKNLAQHKYSII